MTNHKTNISSWLGKYPSKTLHRIGTSIAGIWIASLLINTIWPLPDQVRYKKSLMTFELSNEKGV